jgi:hypothetical protein
LIDCGVIEVPPGSPGQTLVDHIQTGRDAFLDHENVSVEDRDRYQALVEEHGGQWCRIHFTVDHSLLGKQLGRLSP